MKKVITLFLVAVLLLSLATTACAGILCPEKHGTSPRWKESGRDPATYINNGSSGHTKNVKVYFICVYCEALGALSTKADVQSTNENHTLTRTDLGHIAGTRTHRWRCKCSLCSYNAVVENACINCPSINSLEPEIN